MVVNSLKPKVAGLYIETNPTSSIWVNGKLSDEFPFRDTLKPGETLIRLVPDSNLKEYFPYETKVKLVAGVETVIRYEFAESSEKASGEIISFEKNEVRDTSLVAVTVPDSSELIIDRGIRAFTPYKTSVISAGEHILKFSAQGYFDKEVKVMVHKGYKLTAIVKLGKKDEAALRPTPVPTLPPKIEEQEVLILDTGTGFLRVRAKPSSLGEEIGRVTPGKKYLLLATDASTGWFKVEFEEESQPGELIKREGWISNQYAKLVKEGENVPVSSSSPTLVTKNPPLSPAPSPYIDP